MNTNRQHNTDELNAWWAKDESIMHAVYQDGASRFFAAIPGIAAAFAESGTREATCIDEGILSGEFRIAGSGILLPIEDAAELMRKAGVVVVTSHAECGAAGIAYRRERELATDAPVELAEVDAFAVERAKEIAARAGVEHRHIPFDAMERPSGMHIARVIYVDGTGRFQSKGVLGLPRGFVVSRRYLGAANTLHDVRLAISIALGNHGFGERFTPENPLVIIAIGERGVGEFSTALFIKELEPVISEHGGRVGIDEFTFKD